MSLRARVLVWIGVILVICLGLGAGLAGRHAQRSVRVELSAALAGGQRDVEDMLGRAPALADPRGSLRMAVSSFDGARHLRASLTDPRGRLIAASQPMQAQHPEPHWFEALLAPHLAPVTVASQGYLLTLTPIADNEVGEVWSEFRDAILVLALFCLGAAVAIYTTLGQALKPLSALSASFGAIVAGDLEARAPEQGAPELARLARGFNQMAERLGETGRRNARLEEQLLTLQEEERAELARDLHDEIGPQLFVMKIDAAVIRDLAQGDSAPAILGRLQSIEAALAQVQSNVRDLLGRLRPTPVAEFGLAEAIEDLLSFWRARQPDVRFSAELTADDAILTASQRAAVYRLVQEGLSNAARHANPARVEVTVATDANGGLAVSVIDDGAAGSADGRKPGVAGRGLAGMRERVLASGGLLSFGRSPGGRGWRVSARWPRLAPAQTGVDA